jgi:hypothetical protein
MQLLRMCAGVLLAAAGSRAALGAQSAESTQFVRVSGAIVVDGVLDDPSWSAARGVTKFFEIYPGNIAKPTVRTEARFLYDEDHVYVGVSADDPGPRNIRSGFVRRDGVTADQDYIEIFIDPLNTRRTALVFRTNANGVPTDGQYSEDRQLLDPRPDFNFDVRTSVDSRGWHAEFRIPLSTFRYRPGEDQSWAFVIYRNRPRATKERISSAPEPRSAACTLCFASEASGISIKPPVPPVYVTPHVTYAHDQDGADLGAGLDSKWLIRPDIVLDMTLAPDFSQVEADDLQLTANAQFTLALTEKRPFFLEGTDLFAMPINAVYTRAFADPDGGARITHRGEESAYSALLLRDRGGGIVLEPGPIGSIAAPQDFGSSAALARYSRQLGTLTLGTLASARINDGNGENYVYGLDGTWTPNTTDRISAQALGSITTNPDRPDLLPSWDGRTFHGSAYALSWQHASSRWYASALQGVYSSGFRAWNGFVPQVDVSSTSLTGGLLFYPRIPLLQRLSAGFIYAGARELGAGEVTSDFGPSLTLSMPYGTDVTFGWHPNAKTATFSGASTYSYASIMLTTTPAPWMRSASLVATIGDGVDFTTGDINDAVSLVAEVPLRLAERLELTASFGYQAQDSRHAPKQRVFTQRNTQLNVLWHFSSRLYAQVLYQDSEFSAPPAPAQQALALDNMSLSALLSYQANWQTRFFIGARHSTADLGTRTSDSAVFAKFSYVLSRSN